MKEAKYAYLRAERIEIQIQEHWRIPNIDTFAVFVHNCDVSIKDVSIFQATNNCKNEKDIYDMLNKFPDKSPPILFRDSNE